MNFGDEPTAKALPVWNLGSAVHVEATYEKGIKVLSGALETYQPF
jgi:hypothetical protein